MDLALIENLMRMLEQSSLQELDVNDGTTRIRIAKKRTLELDDDLGQDTPDATPAEPAEQGPHRILSGMTGTFYRASAPGVPPYVTEGARVEDGQRIALIEAMKTFNPVECDIAGTVLRILVEDGQSVSVGMPLFEIDAS
ncbi:acetyl-CoA carboxylase biotin carboxyl carrier protein [Rhizobium sp.]